jgi:hypothetical protein
MKLIYCPKCHDVVKIGFLRSVRYCECESCWGYYKRRDKLNAVYGGSAVPLGFANSSLAKAVRNQPEQGMGERFEAFVIPESCPTFMQEEMA